MKANDVTVTDARMKQALSRGVTSVVNENGSDSNGTKVFKIKKVEEKYMIYFVDKFGEETELGELVIKPEV